MPNTKYYIQNTKRQRSPLIVAGILFILLIPAALLAARHPGQVEAEWFDNSWGFRERIDLSNSSGSIQTDFQVQLTFDTATPITAGKMQSNCNDVRLTDNHGKLMPHWLEPTTCNTSTTKIWVKVPSIPTTGAPIYIYYGNSSAAAAPYKTSDVFIREVTGVVASWNMDESAWTNDCATGTVKDTSGNSNQGRACPTSTGPTGGAAGKFGNSGLFTAASSQYVSATNSSSLTGIAAAGSISTWIKYTTNDGTLRTIFDAAGTGNQGLILLAQNTSCAGNSIGLQYGAGTTTGTACSTTVPTTGTWYHVVATWDSTGGKLYFNGSLQGTNTTAPSISVATANSFLGSNGGTLRFLDGNLDDLHIYNRALTAAEITDIYGAGGNNQGYTTTNYAGKELVRKYNTGVTAAAPATEEVGAGPALYWKLDEGTGTQAKDSSANAITGTLTNLPAWTTEDQCLSGKCLKFTGASSQYVTVANTSALNPTTAMSISLWLKRSSLGTRQIFIGKGDALSNATTQYWVELNTSNQLSFNLYSGTNSYILIATDKTITDTSSWHHVTVTWDGTTQRLYLDGLASTVTTAFSGTLNSTSSNFSLGRVGSYNGFYFDGFIDEVKMYRYGRSAAQVQADYVARGSVLGVSTQMGQASTAFLNNGLVGYWKMDEATWSGTLNEVLDWSGNNASGSAQGPTNAKAYPSAGKFGNGGFFDGVDDYVTVPNSSTFNVNNFTFSAWIKKPSFSGFQMIFSNYASSTGYDFRVSGSLLDLAPTGLTGSGWTGSLTGTTNMVANTWYFATATYDGTKLKLYLNGNLENEKALTGTVTASSAPLLIGKRSDGYMWNGNIDEARIYNRALSPGEVQALYNWAPGPVGYWKFDERTGITANDASGYGNGGTLTNSPTRTIGKYGAALSFDGSASFVLGPNSASLQNNNGTIEAWINTSNPGSTYRGIVTKQLAYGMFLNSNEFGAYDWGAGAWRGSGVSLNDGVWHHVTMSFQSGVTNGTFLYIDGILKLTTTITVNAQTQALAAASGAGGAGLQYFNGIIDDVRVYNYARTQQQIVEDMNAGHPTGGSPIGSMLAWWKFDEGQGITANNSGNGGSTLNGTLTNMASPANGTSGWQNSGCRNNRCLAFDGVNDYVSVPNLTISGNQASFTAWVKVTDFSNYRDLIKNTGNGAQGQFYIFLNITNGRLEANLAQNTAEFIPTSSLAGTWAHIAVTYNAGVTTAYVNGISLGSSTGTNNNFNFTGANIGIQSNGTTEPFLGLMDEVKVYTSALTADQVKIDYNAGAAVNYGTGASTEASLLSDGAGASPSAYWNFEEGSGGTVNDVSGNAHTGTWEGTGTSHWTPGKNGRAGKFNGTDDVVTTINNMGITGNAAMTIEAWLKTDTVSSTQGAQCALAFGNAGVALAGAGLCINFAPGGAGTSSFGAGGVSVEFAGGNGARLAAGTIVANQWYHIAAVKTAGAINTTTTIYINGIPQTLSTSSTNTPNITDGTTTLGKFGTSSPFFIGQLDDVKIYNYARTAAQVAYDFNRGLPVGWWKFDECQGGTANDASGNGNTGTITIGGTGTQTSVGTCNTASTAWGNGATGKFNASLNFDGTDDYVQAAHSSSLAITGNMTISVWVKPTNFTVYRGLVSKTGSTNTNLPAPYDYYLNQTDGIPVFLRGDGTNFTSVNGTSAPTTGTWNHLVVVMSGTSVTHYLNGKTNGTGTLSIAIADQGQPLRIGLRTDSVTKMLGQLDDVRIYNYALSAAQIKNIYNGGAGVRYGPASGTP